MEGRDDMRMELAHTAFTQQRPAGRYVVKKMEHDINSLCYAVPKNRCYHSRFLSTQRYQKFM